MSTPKTTASKPPRKVQSLEGAVLRALTKPGRPHVETVRLRPKGSVDRRLIVEFKPDPKDGRAILLRVTPATDAPLPPADPAMLTTQQAADRLNVSRPYVAQLVDSGRFQGVQRTQSGHRRIPLAEVERVEREMRTMRREALDDMAEATRELRERELLAAKAKSAKSGKTKRRWGAKPA
ncbi:MAG: helix-turn-helix domain-containing protein [Acetobacteraceae bacterium]|nr:helix-turn-helix domain-containing protein [Acetobacteraceae bacterium]